MWVMLRLVAAESKTTALRFRIISKLNALVIPGKSFNICNKVDLFVNLKMINRVNNLKLL